MSVPVCTVITVNWNGRGALEKMLSSLASHEDIASLQVMVSDNGSTDGSLEMLEKFPFVEVRENGGNIGFGAANNRALPDAKGEYVLFANPDMEFVEPVVEKLAVLLDGEPAVAACGPKIFNTDGSFMKQSRRGYPDPLTSFFYASGLSALFPMSRRTGRYFMSWLPEDEPSDVDALSGSFFMARRSVLEEIGGFDEAYFLFVEEVDLFKKMRDAGNRLRYFPGAKIIHHGGACFDAQPRKEAFYLYHMTRSHLILWAKDMRSGKGVAGFHLAFLLTIARYAVLSVLRGNFSISANIAEFVSIWRGVK